MWTFWSHMFTFCLYSLKYFCLPVRLNFYCLKPDDDAVAYLISNLSNFIKKIRNSKVWFNFEGKVQMPRSATWDVRLSQILFLLLLLLARKQNPQPAASSLAERTRQSSQCYYNAKPLTHLKIPKSMFFCISPLLQDFTLWNLAHFRAHTCCRLTHLKASWFCKQTLTPWSDFCCLTPKSN